VGEKMVMKAPNSNLQAPEKLQDPIWNDCRLMLDASLELGGWRLVLIRMLVLGIWNL
jgi:hypothetical protein